MSNSIKKQKLDAFDKYMYSAPRIHSKQLKDKIDLFLNGTIPELSEEEFDSLTPFIVQEEKIKVDNLASEVIKEIDFNIVCIVDKPQLDLYLKYVYNILEPIVYVLEEVSYVKRLEEISIEYFEERVRTSEEMNNLNFDVFSDMITNSLTRNQRRFYAVLRDYICYDAPAYYNSYHRVKEHVVYERFRNGLSDNLNMDISEYEVLDQKEQPKKTLKSLFKKESDYHSLLEFMSSEGLILKGEKLKWNCKKYEISTLQQALDTHSLLIKSVNEKELKVLSENTFDSFEVSDKTLRDKNRKVDVSYKKFDEMLSRFKENSPLNLPNLP